MKKSIIIVAILSMLFMSPTAEETIYSVDYMRSLHETGYDSSAYINFIDEIRDYDISSLFLEKKEHAEYKEHGTVTTRPIGFIGEDYQRFYIHFSTISKDNKKPYTYNISGKTKRNDTIYSISGIMKISEVRVEPEGEKFLTHLKLTRVYIIFEYEFKEHDTTKATGTFKGYARSSFCFNKEKSVYYDLSGYDMEAYNNNQFAGIWTTIDTKEKKKCNWGDYRIPDADSLGILSIGYHGRSKFLDRGWRTFSDAFGYEYGFDAEETKNARMIENEEWWKE